MRYLAFPLIALAAVPALAQESPMTGAFGNTIVSTDPSGAVTRTWVDADGKYRSETGGAISSGAWVVRRGMICYSQTSPVAAAPLCTLGPKKRLGSRWSIVQPSGMSVRTQIIAGREGMPPR